MRERAFGGRAAEERLDAAALRVVQRDRDTIDDRNNGSDLVAQRIQPTAQEACPATRNSGKRASGEHPT